MIKLKTIKKGVIMTKFTEKDALELLKKHSNDKKTFEAVLSHSKAVQKAALKITDEVNKNLSSKTDDKIFVCDKEFIKAACIIHDIGRFKCLPVSHGGTNDGEKASLRHGIVGAEILKKEAWPVKFQRVCETHIGIGITKKDIEEKKLPLPAKDYIPETNEEKIIAYADNLCEHDNIKDEAWVVERYKTELGKEYAKRVIAFHEEINDMIKRCK
ncbi:MAG: HD domain-containing protein [Candidatus Woesearchaeota archaeon]